MFTTPKKMWHLTHRKTDGLTPGTKVEVYLSTRKQAVRVLIQDGLVEWSKGEVLITDKGRTFLTLSAPSELTIIHKLEAKRWIK